MNRVKFFLRIYIAAVVIAASAGLLMGYRHSPDQIAAVIATPLILLQLAPYVFLKIPHEHSHEHQEAAREDLLEGRSVKARRVIWAMLVMLSCALALTIAGICILGALPIYHVLHLEWAIVPGAKISAALILTGGIFPAGFVTGLYIAQRMQDVNFFKVLGGIASRQGDRIERHHEAA
jgi:hypothetical protein